MAKKLKKTKSKALVISEFKEKLELLTPEQEKRLEQFLPPWVRELADDASAVLRWNQEFLILTEEILRKNHGFSEKEIVKMEKSIKETLPHLHKMALENLLILRPADMQVALNIVDIHRKQIQKEKIKELPTGADIKAIKQLQAPKKKK